MKKLTTVAAIAAALAIVWKRMNRNSLNNNSTSADTSGPSSKPGPSCTPPDYEVFLSFRGEDTRKEFVDHLYNRLNDAGVWFFRDNEGLRTGERIGPQLIKAIRASKLSIPVISPNYASSPWCFMELVEILEWKKNGQIVLPIFYRVTPSSVRHQTGEFGKAFSSHQKKYGSDDIQKWRNALNEVASLKGLESDKIADGHEGELVKIVLREVLKNLKKTNLVVSDHLIGVHDHKDKIIEMVNAKALGDARVILIHGMGGVGKTTLAKVVYNHFSPSYFYHCFLPNVRERSLNDRDKLDLQKQLISSILGSSWLEDIICIDEAITIICERLRGRKMLFLLDDVSHWNQLKALVGEKGWFGVGNLVIITSRNTDILTKWDNKLVYELKELDWDQSFRLICLHAFGRGSTCQCELEPIAKEIVSMTGGLPLSIELIGSLLFAKTRDSWEDTLKILKRTPNDEVMEKLRISYDSLKHAEKQIFLDIACLSFEAKKELAYYMWEACGFCPRERVKNLISLSLIKIGDQDELIMHDQLKDLGRAIVQEESFKNLGKRSRLWIQEEAWEVLNEQQGTNEVEALSLLRGEDFEDYCLASEQFEDLTKLRLLHLECATLNGDFSNLLTNLKWLQWSECCSEFMPTNFHPRKLVVLDLEKSPITEQWSGWSQQELVKKLKVVKLKLCSRLSTTPDFSAFKELEILILSRLESLNKIEGSIGSVCKTLVTLDVSHCQKLEEIPRQVGELEKLKRLIVDGTTIREIPISGRMMELQVLLAIGCKQLLEIPEIIGSLLNLHTISLTLCGSLKKLLESIGNLGGLSKLDVSHTKLIELPESIGDLQNLKELNISYSQIERLPPGIDESNIPRFIACATAYVQKRQRDSGLRVIPEGDVLRRPARRT